MLYFTNLCLSLWYTGVSCVVYGPCTVVFSPGTTVALAPRLLMVVSLEPPLAESVMFCPATETRSLGELGLLIHSSWSLVLELVGVGRGGWLSVVIGAPSGKLPGAGQMHLLPCLVAVVARWLVAPIAH